jgi:multidrug efflux pump subunit AcrA (membrane-fusion protein)
MVGLANEEGFPHAGTVDFVDNQLNPQTGTIRARAVLQNKDGRFTPGCSPACNCSAAANTRRF